MASSTSIFNFNSYGNWATYAIAIVLTLVACAVAVILRLFSPSDLPFQTFAALIGVIITAIITGVLLKGQSDAERKQKEQAEIFKEKLAACNRFLDALCDYVKTRSDQCQAELKFRTAALAMHGNPAQLTALNNEIAGILAMSGSGTFDDRKLVRSLFAIAELFGKQLYPEQAETPNDDYYKSIENLAKIIDASESVQSISEIEAEDTNEAAADDQEAKNVVSWTDKLAELKASGWKVAVDTAKDTVTLTNPGVNHSISFYKKGRFYVVQSQGEEGDIEYSKSLKTQYKGSRRSNIWWRELTSLPNYGVSNGLSTVIETNGKARAVIVKWIEKLI